jgi:hypothetical protein
MLHLFSLLETRPPLCLLQTRTVLGDRRGAMLSIGGTPKLLPIIFAVHAVAISLPIAWTSSRVDCGTEERDASRSMRGCWMTSKQPIGR